MVAFHFLCFSKYTRGPFRLVKAAKEKITTTSILCEADFPGTIKPAEPTYEKGKIACGKGTTQWPS